MTWKAALETYQDAEPDGPWLMLKHPDGSIRGFHSSDLPAKDELEKLLAEGWRVSDLT